MTGGAPGGPLAAARARVLEGLEPVRAQLEAGGMPVPEWSGKLIRPLVGYAGTATPSGGPVPEVGAIGGAHPGDPAPGDPLWLALAAVQVAHEASLLHDDVIDGARERRGAPTLAASRGVAAALVEGDHLLTAAYRLAVRTGSMEWAELFARAVERTVAGEKAQARAAGRTLEWSSYEAIVLGKSGELLGAALAAAPTLRGAGDAHRYHELGRRVGLVYQMLDDLLDYCPRAATGKPALGDGARGLWTWPLAYVDDPGELDPVEVSRRLEAPDIGGIRPLDRCVARLKAEAVKVSGEAARLLPGDRVIQALLSEWVERAEDAAGTREPPVELPPVAGWRQLMARHARSFRFASRLFPRLERERVVGVYAWCRYTDDLVDGVDLPPFQLEARLDAWLRVSRLAYDTGASGNPLADRVMVEMREAGVPFGYAAELIEGMRMDVRGVEYGTLPELRTYTFRVASVVGLWLTELFGVQDPWMLDRATALGHAMQLTNIARDVGEDLDAGRVYIPGDWLAAHGLERADLERMRRSGVIEPAYRALTERLLVAAEAEYDLAFPAIAHLPDAFRRPVAVAADVYRGIHAAVRDNGYDNLTRRAHTSPGGKLRLGASALWRARRTPAARPTPERARAVVAGLAVLAVLLPAPAPARGQEPGTRAAAVPAGTVAPTISLDTLDTVHAFDTLDILDTRTALAQRVAVAAPGGGDGALRAVASLWVLGVEEPSAVDAGLAAVEELRGRAASAPGREAQDRLLRAYEGAFLALRARHGSWPPARLRDLRDGFRRMDAVVAEAPDAALPRYIRLRSGLGLPAVFGRRGAVDRDLAALARLLPGTRGSFPPGLFPDAVATVLANARLGPEERRRLEGLAP